MEERSGALPGYLAAPKGKGPGLILIHEWWGLNAHIRTVADRFAAAGFTVLAVDLYGGRLATDAETATSLLQGLTETGVEAALKAAAAALLTHPSNSPPRIGVVGFCMGGRLALFAGCRLPEVGAVVDFYGGANPPFPLDFSALKAPVIGLFAGKDPSIPPEAVQTLAEGLRGAGRHVETAVYPEARHAFFNDTRREVYDPAAAADAWERAGGFLRRFLS